MSRIAYVNGRYVPLAHASVHVEDRGFQFADGVYEVLYRHAGRLVDTALHLDRLDRSLRELRLTPPLGRGALLVVVEELARRNRLASGLIYIQVTRGSAPRLHAFPAAGTPPSIVVTMRRSPPFPRSVGAWQAAAITLPDQRWARCDIKSVSLLPNVLAREAGSDPLRCCRHGYGRCEQFGVHRGCGGTASHASAEPCGFAGMHKKCAHVAHGGGRNSGGGV
jgi:D-alanine transaminase